jgi:hypothetical protein
VAAFTVAERRTDEPVGGTMLFDFDWTDLATEASLSRSALSRRFSALLDLRARTALPRRYAPPRQRATMRARAAPRPRLQLGAPLT